MIQVDQLRKQFNDFTAVDNVSFTAEPGQIFGLLGPNGAGKSTTINCISGLLTPTAGSVRVLGHDVVTESVAARASLGVIPQELALYQDLSATQNLDYWGGAQGLRGAALKARIAEVLASVGLADRAKEPVKNFSGGMKRRLNMACGIVHQPKVVMFDEPTVGVDPQSRVKLLEMVREQAATGATVLYTTHYMEEAEQLCDQIAIVDHGKVVAQGSLPELRAMMGERDLLRLSGKFDPESARQALQAVTGLEFVHADEAQMTVSLEHASQQLPQLFSLLGETGAEIRDTTLSHPSLESLFIKLTGKELRE